MLLFTQYSICYCLVSESAAAAAAAADFLVNLELVVMDLHLEELDQEKLQ